MVQPLPDGFTLLQVTPELNAGGVERTTLEIAEAVTAAGGRALVASRGGRLEAQLKRVGGELVPMPVHAKNPLAMAANAARLRGLITRERVSLVHVRSRAPPSPPPGPRGRPACRSWRPITGSTAPSRG